MKHSLLNVSHRFLLASILFISSLCMLSCNYGLQEFLSHGASVNERTTEIKELTDTETTALASALSAKSKYTILVISDVHFGKPDPERHDDDFLAWLDELVNNGVRPDFCISLGDSADHGYKSELDDYNALMAKIQARMQNTTAPVYTIVGNHDLYNSGWNVWKENVYPYTSLYHFATKDFSYYFIDSASDSVGANQIALLTQAFKNDSLPKVVSMHCPMYTDGSTKEGYFTLQDTHEVDALTALFAKYNVKLVLSGHTHMYCRTNWDKFILYNVPGFLTSPPEYEYSRGWSLITIDESKGIIANDEVIFQSQ